MFYFPKIILYGILEILKFCVLKPNFTTIQIRHFPLKYPQDVKVNFSSHLTTANLLIEPIDQHGFSMFKFSSTMQWVTHIDSNAVALLLLFGAKNKYQVATPTTD